MPTWAAALISYRAYELLGTREKTISINAIKDLTDSTISWTAITPAGTSAVVETRIFPGGAWATATSGAAIPGLVAGTDYSGKSLNVRVTLETADFLVTPTLEELIVEINQDAWVVFFGVCGIPESPEYFSTYQLDKYRLIVQSANALLRRRTVSEAYQGKTTSFIVDDLFTKYIEAEGITLGTISTIAFTYTAYTTSRMVLADVLDELAATVGAVWTIDNNKVFHFLLQADFPTVAAEASITDLKKKISGIDRRTVQIISGAKNKTSTQTQTETWGANQKQITLGYPVAETPVITINGTPATVGVSGLDTSDAAISFLWTYDSLSVNLNSIATTKPTTGDTVVVSYKGLFAVEIVSEDAANISAVAIRTGSSGRIENVVIDKTITDTTDGENKADGLLDQFGDNEETLTLMKRGLSNSDLLTVWSFALPRYGIEGDYIVVERRIVPFINQDGAILNKVYLTLKNKNFYMKYGSVFNKLNKDITMLSVRGDEVVLKALRNAEALGLAEAVVFGAGDPVYFSTSGAYTDPEPGLLEPFYPTV